MNKDTGKVIKGVWMYNVKCKTCGETATLRADMINDSICPLKLDLISRCDSCKTHEANEYEVISNDYGVEITCHFSEHEDLDHWVYINSGAEIKLFDAKELIYEIKSEESYIDTVATLLNRIKEENEHKFDNLDEVPLDTEIQINKGLKAIDHWLKTGVFNMSISDNSGFSRVCPKGKTYKDIKGTEPENLNEDQKINHCKVNKW